MKITEIAYVNEDNTARVALAENGRYYPQISEGMQIAPHAPVTCIWKCYFEGYKQFTTISRYKNHATLSGAKRFLNTWIENL